MGPLRYSAACCSTGEEYAGASVRLARSGIHRAGNIVAATFLGSHSHVCCHMLHWAELTARGVSLSRKAFLLRHKTGQPKYEVVSVLLSC
jgi:hypothetical protein